MNYNFDMIIDRRNTRSDKWDSYPPDILPMWIADSDFRCPQPVIDAVTETARRGIFGYTRPDGAFERAYAGWMSERFGWRVAPDWVRWCPSIGTALAVCIRAFTLPGDSVCMLLPTYPPFLNLCGLNGRTVAGSVLHEKNGHYTIDFDNLENTLAHPRTKLLLLCNPHNPTGRAFSLQELQQIGEMCLRHGVMVFSDEIHCDIVYKGRHIPFSTLSPELSAITLVGINASKTFNLADLRSAAVISSNETLLALFTEECNRSKLGRCSLGIAGVIAAYTECADYADQLLVYLRGNMEFAVEYFASHIPAVKTYMPDATFMLWLDCRATGMRQDELQDFFLSKAKVALNSGDSFGEGGHGFMRINLACPRATVAEGLNRISNAFAGSTMRKM